MIIKVVRIMMPASPIAKNVKAATARIAIPSASSRLRAALRADDVANTIAILLFLFSLFN